MMRKANHDRGLITPGRLFILLRNYGKTGHVVAAIFNILNKQAQPVRLCGLPFSDKSLTYLVAAQLLFASGARSALPGFPPGMRR